ncbi:MAG: DUF3857 domain-containing protein [Bacteroidota bacterium]
MNYFSKLLFTVILTGFTWLHSSNAQNLAVSNIPESLLKGANSILRNNETTFTILSNEKIAISEAFSLTIMNEKALILAHLKIFYNTGEKVKINTAAIYNESGVKIKTIRQSEMLDYSTAGDVTLYSDARVIFCKIVPISYPFTIVYDYEITYDHLYAFRSYSPYRSDNQSVVSSSLSLVNPLNIPLNIKTLNMGGDIKPMQSGDTGTWSFSDLLPILEEPFEPPISDLIPTIHIAPEYIQYNKYEGKADTWENYGKWLARLSTGRKSLIPSAIIQLNQLVVNTSSKREKVRILYKYLQSRTHYISISLGIGGIQPHEAADVDELGYGDCKDLSNYMVAMLDMVGIKSFYSLVNSGTGQYQFIKDQPGHQFDHVIVNVPMESDTIWLECTSQINPFGYLGSFTDNRYALAINDDSGQLVRTPEYTIRDNYINSTIIIDHGDEGTAAIGIISYSGLLMDDIVFTANQNQTDREAWINANLEIKDFTLINHRFKIFEDPKPVITLDVDLALKSFFTGANGRLFASMNLNNKIEVPARVRNRKYPLYIPYSYRSCDTLIINMPSGYKPELLPQSTVIDERFGKNTMQTVLEDGKITCIRTFEVYKGTHPPEIYNAFYEFMQKSAVADAKQLVIVEEI